MRRKLYALVAGALGVTLLASPAQVFAQDEDDAPASNVTVNNPPAQQQPATVVVQPAPAEEKTVVVAPTPQQTAMESEETTVANTSVIATGAVTFGLSYGIAAFAASQSDRDSDRRMYVPLLGPWLAIADRDPCPVEQQSCDDETTDKVLMAVDGVFQAAGVVAVVYGVMTPRTVTTRTRTASTESHVVPMSMGRAGSPGIGWVGTF